MELICETSSRGETDVLGRQLGALLVGGAVVALIGPLGAGKTTLTQSIAAGLGAEPRHVTSPTFALVHEYAGRVPVYHFDTYRLPDLRAFVDLGCAEYFSGEGVCIIEWADRVAAALPEQHLRITIDPVSEENRRFRIEGIGSQYDQVVDKLRRAGKES